MIIFALTGGIGNALFALPAIKYFHHRCDVGLVVETDYDAVDLFSRCAFIRRVYSKGATIPRATRYLAAYSVPPNMKGLGVELCGWPHGTETYPHPEWSQIMRRSIGVSVRQDVTSWCEGVKRTGEVDVALIPGGKPGEEWSRKRWKGFLGLALDLRRRGLTVKAFGSSDDVKGAGLEAWWDGPEKLKTLPDSIAKCKIAVSNDCGPGHLASSIGVPTLMLFTATSPIKGEPIGPHRIIASGCDRAPRGCQSTRLWKDCRNWLCADISIERVVADVEDMLKK